MSNYEDIYGKRVKELSADPTLNSSYEGQVWYNSTEGVLKSVVSFAAFSSGGPLSSPRIQMGGIGSTNSAAIAAGGGPSSDSEEYNGVGWTTTPSLNQSRTILGGSPSGSVTAGIVYGGQTGGSGTTQGSTENYDGTSWTEVNNLNTARAAMGAAGTASSNLAFGGDPTGVGAVTDATESWNGTSWTEVNNLNDNGTYLAGVGSGNDSALAIDGGSRTSASEQWDGTSWTSTPNTNLDIQSRQAFGTATSAIAAGGNYVTTVEEWNNTVWSTSPLTLSIAVGQGYGIGSASTNGLVFGGQVPSIPGSTGATEEYNLSINTITAGAWASGGNLNTGRQDVGGTGTKSAGLAIGGRTGASSPFTQSGVCEEYNGATWSEQNDLNTARGEASGSGTQTAALCFGGAPNSTATENYDGSSWTTSPATLNTGRSSGASFGASDTSAVFCGGYGPSSRQDAVEEYNGSAWTSVTSMPIVRYNAGGAGIETAGIVLGGGNSTGTVSLSSSNEYDGSSWTTGGSTPVVIEGQGMNGTQTACIAYGGPSSLTTTYTYDGTTFVTNPSMASNRSTLGASKGASITNTVGFGGSTPPNRQMTNTEEFTAGTSVVTSKTLTTS